MTSKCCTPVEFWEKITRTKVIDDDDLLKTDLKRCITTPWLILLGIGHMAGAGIYILTGEVMRAHSGPATPIAYLMAGAVSMLSALCYAEFGARVPRSGSSFTFAYVTVGEFMAFVIGWNILLEHCISAAATARVWSSSVNFLTDGWLFNVTSNATGFFYFGDEREYPDFVAMLLVIVVATLVLFGIRETVGIIAIVAICNMIIACIITVTAFFEGDFENVKNSQRGGYVPFGAQGLFSGTAMLIYAYYGYDVITIAAEETKNPSSAIPVANISAMAIVTAMYFVMSLSLSFLTPFHVVDSDAAFAAAFLRKDMGWASKLSGIGATIAITGVCMGSIYSVSRMAFAMARDGILFKFIGYVNKNTQTPLIAIICFGVVAAILACVLNVQTLAEFVNIGSLLALSIVAACVIVLRYITDQPEGFGIDPRDEDSRELINPTLKVGKLKPQFGRIPCFNRFRSGRLVGLCAAGITLPMIGIGLLIRYGGYWSHWWQFLILGIFLLLIIVFYSIIIMHHKATKSPFFQMPFVPCLPVISMLINIILLVQISTEAWMRFGIWMAVGLVVYFGYSIWFSTERFNQIAPDGRRRQSYPPPSYGSRASSLASMEFEN